MNDQYPMYYQQQKYIKLYVLVLVFSIDRIIMPRLKRKSLSQRKANIHESVKRFRDNLSPDSKQSQRDTDRIGHRDKRSIETQDEAHERISRERQRWCKKRKFETSQETSERLKLNKICKQKAREKETEEETTQRQTKDRMRTKDAREKESEEETTRRQTKDKTRTKDARDRETEEETTRRQTKDRTRRKDARDKEREEETDEIPEELEKAKKASAEKFNQNTAEGPIYACVSCYRLMYRSSVVELKEGKYPKEQNVLQIITHAHKPTTHEKGWLCHTCHLHLKKGKIPCQAWSNNLQLDEVPHVLQDLRPLEVRLISQRTPFMKLVALPRGGQKCIHGAAVNVPSSLQPVVSLLPRLPHNVEVVPLKLKRKLTYKSHYMHEFIRPNKVMLALTWLKENNKLYRNVDVDMEWIKNWQEEDNDLFEAMFADTPGEDNETRNHDATMSLQGDVNNIEMHDDKPSASNNNEDKTNGVDNKCAAGDDDNVHVSVSCANLVEANDIPFNCQSIPTAGDSETTIIYSHPLNPSFQSIPFELESETGDNQACIDVERTHDMTPAGDNSVSNRKRHTMENLKRIALKKGFKIVDVPGDGNCFFYAVLHGIKSFNFMQHPSGPELRHKVIEFFESNDDYSLHYRHFLENGTDVDSISSSGRFNSYVEDLRKGAWADHVTVQAVADMLNINIRVLNTISPDWAHNIQPRAQNSPNVVNIGLIGENHYVALEVLKPETPEDQEDTKEKEHKEDQIHFEKVSSLRGLPYDTLLQEENQTYSVAPGEGEKPVPFFTDPSYEELANPTKFPYGTGGLTAERQTITPRKYINQRLLHKDGRFAKDIDYLLAAQSAIEAKQIRGDISISLRQTRGQIFQNQRITAGLLKDKGKLQALIRNDMAVKFLKNVRGSPAYWNVVLLDLLAMVRQLGIPTWFLTLSAADMKWPEVIQSIGIQYGRHFSKEEVQDMSWENKCMWLRSNPITAARHFQHRLDAFFVDFLKGPGHPIGKITDHMIRIEFQARGSPHAHCLLWIENSPKIDESTDEEVADFVDRYQTCTVPTQEGELKDLVLSVQKHVHSPTCRKSNGCRFKFPHLPSQNTVIAREQNQTNYADYASYSAAVNQLNTEKQEVLEKLSKVFNDAPEDVSFENLLQLANIDPELYSKIVQHMASGKKVVVRRKPGERWINHYNPDILSTWKANMDLQFVIDAYACILYITSYIMKSERAMSELLKKVAKESANEEIMAMLRKVGSAFLTHREVSAQEAAYRLLSLPLKKFSRKVKFVNTSPKEKRVKMLKPQSHLDDMHDDEEDIFCTSDIDRYAARPHQLENMCYAEFSATYDSNSGKSNEDHYHDVLNETPHSNDASQDQPNLPKVIKLNNNLGYMSKRKLQCVIRFHREKKEGEEKYRNMLMLYWPWRDEEELKGPYDSFKEHFDSIKEHIIENELKFSVNADSIDEAYENLQENGPPDDAWNNVAPNVEFQETEDRNEGEVVERDNPQEDGINVDLEQEQAPARSELHQRFSAELNKSIMTRAEYCEMMRQLNKEQREAVFFHRKWCKETIVALKNNEKPPQYNVFLSGPGGVGKSHVIKLVHYDTLALLRPHSNYFEPDELATLLTAFTGTAAFNIDGLTIHSALGLSSGPRSKKEYQPAGSEKLNTLRSRLGKIKLLVIDEVSMVGSDLLYHIHRRLQEISGASGPDSRFGNVSILAVGDLYQLQPVGQGHVFQLPSDPYARLHGSIWKENFQLLELQQSMRQRGDVVFADLLMRLRKGQCTEEDLDLLQTRVISKQDQLYPADVLHVFKTNKEVDEHNSDHMLKLATEKFNIKAIDKKKDLKTGQLDVQISSKASDTGGLREVVSVAVGARVMVTVNIDVADGLSNGVVGTVTGIVRNNQDVQTVLVKFDSNRVGQKAMRDSEYRQQYHGSVPIKRVDVSFSVGSGRNSVEAKRSQFPLTLAWGCTIHKVQGKTMDKVVVSMQGKSSFMPGQAYVAFSRVKTLSGLFLLGFDKTSIKVNPAVIQEMTRLQSFRLPPLQPNPIKLDGVIQIGLLNVRSIPQHLEDVKLDKNVHVPDIFCFQETFLKRKHQLQIFEESKCYRVDRPDDTAGGGLLTVAKNELNTELLGSSTVNIEHISVRFRIARNTESLSVNLISIYKPPLCPQEMLKNKVESLLGSFPSEHINIICGDFNIDLLKNPYNNVSVFLRQHGYNQIVQAPTTDYGSLLDHVYIKKPSEDLQTKCHVLDTYYSDHDIVLVELSFQ